MKKISISIWEMDPNSDKIVFGMPIMIYNSNLRTYQIVNYLGNGEELGNTKNPANHYFCLEDPEQFYREGGKSNDE